MQQHSTDTASTAELSFFQNRMHQIGVTDANNVITVYDPEAEFPQPGHYATAVFSEDKQSGDIEILYYRINGDLIRYEHTTEAKTGHINAKTRLYKSRRLKEPKGDMKYRNPAGQETLPWFPPALVEKYKKREQVPTLILTEGVFKAMCGSIAGLDVVGLPSITCYKNKAGKLYDDIALLIEACNVIDVVILWDGDCLNISRKDLQVGDEITNRPFTFFNSAKKIGELVHKIDFGKTREKCNIWYMHVKPDSMPDLPKGLDDLLISTRKAGSDGRVVQELSKPGAADRPFFFVSYNITSGTGALYKYFRLDSVDNFYKLHMEIIQSREFKFKGSIYQWSEVNDALEMRAPEWANRVKWVGDEFFLDDVVPGAYGEMRKLIAYKQGQFTKMFGDKFWQHLTHHRAFVNIPDHFNYQQIIEKTDGARYYNRYFPFPHVPQEGKWDTIKEFLLHVFGDTPVRHAITGKEYQPIDIALDYIQLLLTRPTQMLPILCFYSAENNTGKSTFGKLMMAMFGDNVVPIGNNELQSDFNDVFVDKLLAVCEETLLERKRDAERLKALSTSEKVTVNPKGQKQYTIDFFCKFIFTSNNMRMIYLSKHDQRYWVIHVPVVKKENPNMLEEMKAEIPALVQHLITRTLATEKEGRMWFHHSLTKTQIMEAMVRVNEPSEATNMREVLRDWFIADPELQEVRMTKKEIKQEFFSDRTNAAWITEILRDYLSVDLVRNADGTPKFERGYYQKFERYHDNGAEELKPVRIAYRGNPYCFQRAQFLTENIAYDDENVPAAAATPPEKGIIERAKELSDELPF